MKSRILVLIFTVVTMAIVTSGTTYAQIDSRNQTRPEREQSAAEANKKKKKDRKNRDKSRRLKSKKELRAAKKRDRGSNNRKIYSNKKQIKDNRRSARRAKSVDKGYKGDITGRKMDKPRDRQREINRTYEQPDPYRNRRIRTERSRAGPDAPVVRSATKRGEKARTGDISGQRTVRQKSRRSEPKPAYAQPNPYVGRKVKSEKERAKSNERQIRSVRSATRPAESNPPRTNRMARRGPTFSASSQGRVKQKRNVYRNHDRFGGEKSTSRDIAGRKLRTRNTRSAVAAAPLPYSSINPYSKSKRYGEGQRYRRTANRYSSARSISRSSESGANRRYDSRYGQSRNRRTVRTTGFVSAKRIRSTADPRSGGEKRIFGDKYQSPSVRSASRRAESSGPKKPKGAFSVSGQRKTYRQRNTYQGKDRHFGENSTTKDIAGRKLRTRNKRSYHPTWFEFGGGTYGTGSVSGKPTKKYASAGGRRKSRANWNNSGLPIFGRGPGPRGESAFTGNLPANAMPSYGPGREGVFQGRMPLGAIQGYSGNQGSTYRGKMKAKDLRKYRGGNESLYAGNRKARKRLQGGGSISAFWNNNGSPIAGRGPGPRGESSYSGRMPLRGGYGPGQGSKYSGRIPLSAMPSYGPGKASTYTGRMPLRGGYGPGPGSQFTGRTPLTGGYGPGPGSQFTGRTPLGGGYGPGREGTYQGNLKGYRPLKGGGSITTFWNNKGQAIRKRDRSSIDLASSGYKGNMPLKALPGYGSGGEGNFQGNMKAQKPLKGGGSITTQWNNNFQPIEGRGPGKYAVGRYTGSMPLSALPGYGDSKIGFYQGTMKAKKRLKGAGGSITSQWNNNFQPIEGRGPGKYAVGRYTGSMPLSALPGYGDSKIGFYQGTMKAKKRLKGAGGSITTQWNNDFQPIEGRGPGKYDVGRFGGNLPMSALPGYGDGKEGTYKGNMKRQDTKIKQSPGTERGRTKSFTFLRLGDPQHMGLNHREKNLKVKNDLPKELSRVERKRLEDAGGMDRGRTQSLSFLTLGDPTRGGLHAEMGNKKRMRDLPNEIKGKQRLRLVDAKGLDRGRTRSFTFLKIGDPNHGGLHAEMGNKKRKNDLPSGITGKNKIRLADADGLHNGTRKTFSFWAIGDPTRGGLVRSPAQARGRLHPSSDYTKAGKPYNSIDKKEQPVKLKLWFAKLFKRQANQPDAVKEKERRPRYNKNEREIWETAIREDWYKN